MLVLSRKRQEAVVVVRNGGDGGVMRIIVLHISHGRVRLGFDVDGGVSVHRMEVWERVVQSDSHDENIAHP